MKINKRGQQTSAFLSVQN